MGENIYLQAAFKDVPGVEAEKESEERSRSSGFTLNSLEINLE
jgi:hypothetical protein